MRGSFVAFAGFVACAAAACGGETTGGGSRPSVTGTIAGKPATPSVDSIAMLGQQQEQLGSQIVEKSFAGVVLTNQANTCWIVQQGGDPANATAISLSVTAPASAAGVPAGTYAIQANAGSAGSQQASAEYVAQDATCTATTTESAASGTITLSSVTPAAISGSFDITFPGGDHLAGSFSSPVCAASPGQGQAQPVCKSY